MNGSKLIEEINRLFEQLVRDPWAGVPQPGLRLAPGERAYEVALPIPLGRQGDVSVAIEGGRLVVRAQRAGGGGETPATIAEHVFTLPEDAEVTGLEAQFEDDTLRVRLRLRARWSRR
jgi:HSP20 family molecular chaperone IbpA